MRFITVILITAMMGFLSACAATEPAPITYSEPGSAKWCMDAANLLGNQYLDPWKKQLLFEKMRNNGCMD